MKLFPPSAGITFFAALLMAFNTVSMARAADSAVDVPKYNPILESTFKGTIVETTNRQCPMSGGSGYHAILQLEDGKTIEVHMAPTEFVRSWSLFLSKGDKVSVIGEKLTFEGKETMFAREMTRDTDTSFETYIFRDKTGTPIW